MIKAMVRFLVLTPSERIEMKKGLERSFRPNPPCGPPPKVLGKPGSGGSNKRANGNYIVPHRRGG